MIHLNVETFKQRFPQFGAALNPDELAAFIRLLKIQIVEASEDLIVEGTETDSLYFVWEGELDVMVAGADEPHKIARVESGDLLGEISLLSPGKTTATVRSELGCVALHLDVASLETFWEDHPHAASVFLKILSETVAQRLRSVVATLHTLDSDSDASITAKS